MQSESKTMFPFLSLLMKYCVICFRAMEDRITRLHGQLQRIHHERMSTGNMNSSFDHTLITVLHEDLHWLVLIAGKFVLHGKLKVKVWSPV